jgi:hypothetical protein
MTLGCSVETVVEASVGKIPDEVEAVVPQLVALTRTSTTRIKTINLDMVFFIIFPLEVNLTAL